MSHPSAPGTEPARSRAWVFAPLLIFGVMAALFGFALTSGDPSKLPSALIGRPVPATEFKPLDGLVRDGSAVPGFSAADLKSGVSVVNFWASWCAPCVEEHPLLAELANEAGVPVYGVNYKDKTEAGLRFLGRHGNPFTAVGVDPNGRGAIEWGVYGMPETFVVNAKGQIAYKHVGPITAASLKDKVLPAIAAAKAAQAAK